MTAHLVRALLLSLTIAVGAPAVAAPPPAVGALLSRAGEPGSKWKVGEWVTYELNGGRDRLMYMRLAVVGEEKDIKGRPAVWIEMEFGSKGSLVAPLLQMRVLTARSEGLSSTGVTRLFIALGTGKPEEASEEVLARLFAGFPAASKATGRTPSDAYRPNTHMGAPSALMTAAGTVRATPVEIRVRQSVIKRLWLSADVPVLSLAKLELPPIGQAVEAYEMGLGAKPRMVLPRPDEPKLTLSRAEDFWTRLSEEGGDDEQPASPTTPP